MKQPQVKSSPNSNECSFNGCPMRGRSAPIVVSEAVSLVSAGASDASAGLAPRETACARPGEAAERCRNVYGDVVLAVGNREGWPEKHRWTCPSQPCSHLGLFYHAGCLVSRPKVRHVGEGRGGLGSCAIADASSDTEPAESLALTSDQLQIRRVVDSVSKTTANETVGASVRRSGFQSAGGPLREGPSPTLAKTPRAISANGSVSGRTEDMFNPSETIITIEDDMDYQGSGGNDGRDSVSTSMSTGQVTASADARGRRDGALSSGGQVRKRVKMVEYLCPRCGRILVTQDQMEETQR